MERLLVLTSFEELQRKRIEALAKGRVEPVFMSGPKDDATYHEQLRLANVILGDPEPAELKYCEHLRLMQTTWAGVDAYIKSGVFPKDAVLCNMTGAYGPIIADYVLGITLTLCLRFTQYKKNQDLNLWHKIGSCKSLQEATVLIVGAGNIGQEVAKRFRPCVERLIGIRRTSNKKIPFFDEMGMQNDLDTWLPEADVVILCLPETDSTRLMMDDTRLQLLKHDAVLVNVGRGSAIDLNALAKKLEMGHLWGVGLDVTEPEPLPEDHPLWHAPRSLITPHISGGSYAKKSYTDRLIQTMMVDNFENYVYQRPLNNIVDFETGYRK